MKIHKRTAVLILLGSLGLASIWFGWRWFTTPTPPNIALDGLYPEIVEVVRNALDDVRRQPRSGETWGKLALVLAANGFEDEALPCVIHAESFAPNDAHWPYLHGNLLFLRNSLDALPLFRRALALTALPENRAPILLRLAGILIENEQLAEAETYLATLQQIEPDSPRSHYGQALLAIARDDRAPARAHLQTLVEDPMARKMANRLLGNLEAEDANLARQYAQRAAKLPADDPWPDPFDEQRRMLKVHRTKRLDPFEEMQRAGRHEDARNFLRKLIAEAPDAELWFRLGFAAYQHGQLAEAEQAFRQAAQFDARTNVKAHVFLGTVLLLEGEKCLQQPNGKAAADAFFQQALEAAQAALKLQETGQPHFVRGQALKHLARTDESEKALRQAVLCQPESAEFHLALGETLIELRNFPEALKHLEFAVQLAAPSYTRPRETLEKWRSKARSQ